MFLIFFLAPLSFSNSTHYHIIYLLNCVIKMVPVSGDASILCQCMGGKPAQAVKDGQQETMYTIRFTFTM